MIRFHPSCYLGELTLNSDSSVCKFVTSKIPTELKGSPSTGYYHRVPTCYRLKRLRRKKNVKSFDDDEMWARYQIMTVEEIHWFISIFITLLKRHGPIHSPESTSSLSSFIQILFAVFKGKLVWLVAPNNSGTIEQRKWYSRRNKRRTVIHTQKM